MKRREIHCDWVVLQLIGSVTADAIFHWFPNWKVGRG